MIRGGIHLSQGGDGASAQHCTAMTNWPNTIQCLRSDEIMSLGIKSSATEVLGPWFVTMCCYLLPFLLLVVAGGL